MSFRVLVVCTGNICRSPFVEHVLRMRLEPVPGVVIVSAGTAALVGHPMDERAADHARRLGADPTAHRARQMTVDDVRGADLILTASRAHRRAVVESVPRASRITFTLREFERLVDQAPLLTESGGRRHGGRHAPDGDATRVDLTAFVEDAAVSRGALPPHPAEDDDIVDPYRQSDDVYADSVRRMLSATASVASALRRAAGYDEDRDPCP